MSDTALFVTTCPEYRVVVRALSARSATNWAQKRYGTAVGTFHSKVAGSEELRAHLEAGAVFWDADTDTVIPRDEAHALASDALSTKR